METFTRWVYYFLESLGLDLSYMTNLNRLIVLVLIAVLAFLTDWICRKGIVRLVRKVTQKTKVTWDDLLFNDRVMNNFCHILPPVVVYILCRSLSPTDRMPWRLSESCVWCIL